MQKYKRNRKITKSHGTVMESAVPVVKKATQLPEVSKVALGVINPLGHGRRRLKFIRIDSGWKVMIRGSTAAQEIFVYTSNPEKTKHALEEVFK